MKVVWELCHNTHTRTRTVCRFYLSSVTGSFYSCLASLSLITQESSLFAIQLCKNLQTPCCCTNSMYGQVSLLKSYSYYGFNLILYRKGEYMDVSRGELANAKFFFAFQMQCFRSLLYTVCFWGLSSIALEHNKHLFCPRSGCLVILLFGLDYAQIFQY